MHNTSVRDYGDRDKRDAFHTGVSLHAHTHYSREVLADLPAYLLRVPVVAAWYRYNVKASLAREGHGLDFSRGWWHPPVAPRVVFESEVRQIEERLGLWPLVSITDHDELAAGFDLQRLCAPSRAPLSFEWTVPYAHGYFHLGIHNLPPETANEWFLRLSAFTAQTSGETLENLLADLNRRPDILIVFNHPCWDLADVGRDEHQKQMRRFLAAYGTQLHALELNGYRPQKENAAVHDLAAATGHPLISGGDRHGCAPNALLNLTNARSFAEFAAEVRDGVSHVLVMPEYRQHLATRMIASAADVMRWYRLYPAGRQHWTDRVTWDLGGSVRPLSFHWRDGGPLWVRGTVKVFQVISSPVVLRCIRAALEAADGMLAARNRGAVQAGGGGAERAALRG
jgi:hypothetical protein